MSFRITDKSAAQRVATYCVLLSADRDTSLFRSSSGAEYEVPNTLLRVRKPRAKKLEAAPITPVVVQEQHEIDHPVLARRIEEYDGEVLVETAAGWITYAEWCKLTHVKPHKPTVHHERLENSTDCPYFAKWGRRSFVVWKQVGRRKNMVARGFKTMRSAQEHIELLLEADAQFGGK